MNLQADKPRKIGKETYLQENAVYQNTCLCDEIYQKDCTLSALHFHEFLEISFVISGNGIHRIWNETMECKKGDVFIMNKGVSHGYFAKDSENVPEVCNLLFDIDDFFEGEIADSENSRFCYGIFRENVSAAYLSLKPRQLECLEQIYEIIHKENSVRASEWRDAVKAQISLFLIMVRRFQDENEAYKKPVKSKEQMIVANTVRYVMEHYSDAEMTLGDIADSLFMSKSYLSKMFHNITGEYFAGYLRKVRMKQAGFLLENTKLTNEEIMKYCGIKDITGFYRMFREEYSMTPHQYRKKY